MAVVLLCALQNFLFQFIFVKMRDEVPLSCSWDKVGIEGLSSQLNPNQGSTKLLPYIYTFIYTYIILAEMTLWEARFE